MNLTQLKKRRLDNFLVMIQVMRTEVKVEYEGRVCNKYLYTFVGINILGKRKYLTYGINYRENTEFWLQKFKDIRERGVDIVLYLVTPDIKLATRASQITFNGIRVIETSFELIERVNKYFPNNYTNKFPNDVNNLYLCKSVSCYKNELDIFYEIYKDKKIIKLLLTEKLNNIEKYYDLTYNIRKLLFPYYWIREHKNLIRKAMNEVIIIKDLDEFYNRFTKIIINQERTMLLTKKKWLEILNEICSIDIVKEYI